MLYFYYSFKLHIFMLIVRFTNEVNSSMFLSSIRIRSGSAVRMMVQHPRPWIQVVASLTVPPRLPRRA